VCLSQVKCDSRCFVVVFIQFGCNICKRCVCFVVSVDQLAPSFSLVVKNLRPSFGYTFSVAAVNDAGEGPASSFSTILYIPEEGKWFIEIFHTTDASFQLSLLFSYSIPNNF